MKSNILALFCVAILNNASVEGHRVISDPICSSAGCTQYKHVSKGLGYKINYPVPNFGKDHDLNDQSDHVKLAESILKHEWTPQPADKKDKGSHVWGSGDNRWVVPTAGADFFLTEDDKDYNTAIHGTTYY